MKANCAGVEALASAVWLLWMARYTEYSMIFPDVTDGGSQVRWAPSELCGPTGEKGRSVQIICCYITPPLFNQWRYLANFNGTRRPWEAR